MVREMGGRCSQAVCRCFRKPTWSSWFEVFSELETSHTFVLDFPAHGPAEPWVLSTGPYPKPGVIMNDESRVCKRGKGKLSRARNHQYVVGSMRPIVHDAVSSFLAALDGSYFVAKTGVSQWTNSERLSGCWHCFCNHANPSARD